METNTQIACSSCSKLLPATGFFCGGCLTQFKCKSCGSMLEADNIGCTNCGTAKDLKAEPNKATQNVNTFRLHETLNDRTIEATFSDVVGKDLADILRDTSANRQWPLALNGMLKPDVYEKQDQEIQQLTEAEIINSHDNDEIKETATQPAVSMARDYPTLKAIAMKNLPSNETEWIVVYAFYASKFGEDVFSRQAIVDKYSESNRKSSEKIKSLTAYITAAVRGSYINPLENGYSILPKGIVKAQEIISRTSSSAPKAKSSSKKKEDTEAEGKTDKVKKNRSGAKNFKCLTDLNFYPTGKDSLDEFMKKFTVKNDNERNLLFVNYLTDILNIKNVTLDHIYTCYDEIGAKIPENLTGSLNNTKGRTGWLESNDSGLVVTTKGKNKLRFWDKKD